MRAYQKPHAHEVQQQFDELLNYRHDEFELVVRRHCLEIPYSPNYYWNFNRIFNKGLGVYGLTKIFNNGFSGTLKFDKQQTPHEHQRIRTHYTYYVPAAGIQNFNNHLAQQVPPVAPVVADVLPNVIRAPSHPISQPNTRTTFYVPRDSEAADLLEEDESSSDEF